MRKLLLILALAGIAAAADFSGEWTATNKIGPDWLNLRLNLTQNGADLAGSIVTSQNPKEAPIEDPVLHGDDLTFEIHDRQNHLLKFHLKLAGGTLSGERTLGDEVSPITFSRLPKMVELDHAGRIVAPILLHKAEPKYTEEARAAKLQGTVVVQVEIEPDGTVSSPKVVHSLGMGLDENAVQCVQSYRFRAALRDGAPVATAATIEVNFRLPN